jgi:hypothetical protein
MDIMKPWRPPEYGWVKINVDAGFNSQDSKSYTGCVARDHGGRCANAEEGEATGALVALHTIPKPDNLCVLLESDNVGVVDAIKRRNQKLSTLRRTYDEIGISEARFGNFKVKILLPPSQALGRISFSEISSMNKART